MNSALYEGTVRHRRFAPVRHEFRHRVAMAYVDLGELDPGGALDGVLSRRRTALVRFSRSDYLGDPTQPLDQEVRDLVEQQSGVRPKGPVRMLTQLRTAGWNFNPITLYYCFSPEDRRIDAIVYEVTNTPWGERHAYVVLPDQTGRFARIAMDKKMHVSPFMAMDVDYHVSAVTPGERCSVRFALSRDGTQLFDADLSCRRAASLDRSGLRRLAVRHPLMPLVVTVEIYVEAVRLALKGAPFHRHPPRMGETETKDAHRPDATGRETRRKVA